MMNGPLVTNQNASSILLGDKMSEELATNKDLILEMWKSGHSSRDIAKAVGKTRNAIIGLIYRFRSKGLVGYRIEPVIKKKACPMPKNKVSRQPKIKKLPIPKAKPLQDSEPITFIELQALSCRYVVSDGLPKDFLFCGKMVISAPYCSDHKALCYTRNETREI
jgi:hypothetical protein